jgi:antitoxin ParD1/3/4
MLGARARSVSVPPRLDSLTTVDSRGEHGDVSRNTMSFALPEELRAYVDERVASGDYGNTSEYLRELIRRDREEQAIRRLRSLVADGLESGAPVPLTDARVEQLRRRALGSKR